MKRTTFAIFFFAKKARPLRDGSIPLYVRITINKKSKETALGISIDTEKWDSKNQKAIGRSIDAVDTNDELDEIKSNIRTKRKQLLGSGKEPTAESLMHLYKGTEARKPTILDLFNEHQKRFSELIEKGHFSKRTLQRYDTALGHLTSYLAKEYGGKDLLANELDLRFINGFEHYLKVEVGCQHNSAMKHMKALRKIVLHAVRENDIQQDPFHHYTIRTVPVEKEFLLQSEIDQIYMKELDNKRLATVRDMFILQCYTGMAYCDILALKTKHLVKGDDGGIWIIKKREKTGVTFRIPMLPRAQEVLNRYTPTSDLPEQTLLPISSNQKMNAYLKEIGDLCGISKSLTTHMGRHTFATTITLDNDITKPVLQDMMGLSKTETLEIYAKMQRSRISREMANLRLRLGD